MKAMHPYLALAYQSKLKEMFLQDFKKVLSKDKEVLERGKLNFINYSQLKNWNVRELNSDLGEVEQALYDKVEHMIYKTDMDSVLRMLYSFRNGVKRLPYRDKDDLYEWTNKDGNEKFSHKGNLPLAHFRFNWDKRYIIPESTLNNIKAFVDTIYEEHEDINARDRGTKV